MHNDFLRRRQLITLWVLWSFYACNKVGYDIAIFTRQLITIWVLWSFYACNKVGYDIAIFTRQLITLWVLWPFYACNKVGYDIAIFTRRNSPFFGKSCCFRSSSRPRIALALMEKDSDLPETGTEGVGLTVDERLPGKGSMIETTERNLLHSIMQVLCWYVQEKWSPSASWTEWRSLLDKPFLYLAWPDKQRRSDKDVVFW